MVNLRATGSALHIWDGEASQNYLGWSLADAGDLNDDGIHDVLIGAPRTGSDPELGGIAYVFSCSPTYEELLRIEPPSAPQDWLGFAVAGIGDINLDGKNDLLIGAPYSQIGSPGVNRGRVIVASGLDGSVLFDIAGDLYPPPNAFYGEVFGLALSAAGDVNADGRPDFIVAAPAALGVPLLPGEAFVAGRAAVYSGLDGQLIHEFIGTVYLGDFGSSVSGGGDLNADGHSDVLVGQPNATVDAMTRGRVFAYSGLDGSELVMIESNYLFTPGDNYDYFGAAICGGSDVNADGQPDLAIGAWGADSVLGGRGHVTLVLSTPVQTTPPCPGDLNIDQSVNVDDLNAVLGAWGSSCEE